MINKAVGESMVSGLEAAGIKEGAIISQLTEIYTSNAPLLGKVENFDAFVEATPEIKDFQEILFDLMLVNFFAEDTKDLKEDYFESAEWADIEEKTLDRGTELLSILLYISESHDENIEPDLSDFIKEFLLIDDSEYQDEHKIYESFIANQALMDSDYAEIARVAKGLDAEDEMKDLFYPVMSFLLNPKPNEEEKLDFEKSIVNTSFDKMVYGVLLSYYNTL